MLKFILKSFFLVSFLGFSQEKDSISFEEKYKDYYYITSPNQAIQLSEVVLFPPPKFKTHYDRRYYLWLKTKTYKAYPYAVLAKEKINLINDSIQKISSKRKRKKYIKQKQKFFEEEFSENVKKLTRTEGRVLIKLIHRLTGLTVDEHVKEKRGKFKAFWYRFSASLFKIKLDLEYHPENVMEDYMIESILRQAFMNGDLKEEPSVLESANFVYPNRVIEVKKKK